MNETRKLTVGNWIAIAATATTLLSVGIGVLGSVLAIALGEHNERIARIESDVGSIRTSQRALTEGQLELGGEVKRLDEHLNGMENGIDERLDRIEASIGKLIDLHMASAEGRPQPHPRTAGDHPRTTGGRRPPRPHQEDVLKHARQRMPQLIARAWKAHATSRPPANI